MMGFSFRFIGYYLLEGINVRWLYTTLFICAFIIIMSVLDVKLVPGWALNVLVEPVTAIMLMAIGARAFASRMGSLITGMEPVLSEKEAERAFEQKFEEEKAHRARKDERYSDAVKHYMRLLELKPYDIITRRWLAMIYLDKLGKPDRALNYLKELARLAPRDSEIRKEALLTMKKIAKGSHGRNL